MLCVCVLCYPDVSPKDIIITCKLKAKIPDPTSQPLAAFCPLFISQDRVSLEYTQNSNSLSACWSFFPPGSLPNPLPSSSHRTKTTKREGAQPSQDVGICGMGRLWWVWMDPHSATWVCCHRGRGEVNGGSAGVGRGGGWLILLLTQLPQDRVACISRKALWCHTSSY